MTTAREIMSEDTTYCSTDTTAAVAARRMASEDIGAVPVCDADGHLSGVVTDRDLAVKIVAEGRDPASVRLGELIDESEAVTIGADDTAEEAIRTMKDHAVRRLPVIDGTDLVGMVSQADIARAMPDAKIGDLVDAISSAPLERLRIDPMTKVLERLDGATVVVVGASSGFGRGAALELGRRGANVVVAARRGELLDEVAQQIGDAGGSAIAVTADVSEPTDIDGILRASLDRYGRVDVWVNNVGVGALGFFWEIPTDVHARVVDVNLKGLIYGAHAALGQFVRQGAGTLVNVGSIDSEVPLALQNTYAATKAGVLSLSRSLSEELRLVGLDDKIKVATIMPWAVDTPWWEHAANFSGHTPRMAAMDDPQIVVDAIVEACLDPGEETPVGAKARASDFTHHLFPDLTERLSATIADRERRRGDEVPDSTGTLFEPMEKGRTVEGGVRERMAREDANT